MKILIACEFSGIMREAFASAGHDVTSCDLLPTEIPGKHYCGDVRDILNNEWDMMIAHPPCTYLALSGNRWRKRPGREAFTEEALEFAKFLWKAPIPKIVLEQPRSILSSHIGRITQSIQPYYFGVSEFKTMWLWIKGLPKLQFTKKLIPPRWGTYTHDDWSLVHRAAPGSDRWKERSRSYPEIAQAMADQWGRQ